VTGKISFVLVDYTGVVMYETRKPRQYTFGPPLYRIISKAAWYCASFQVDLPNGFMLISIMERDVEGRIE
jgi:hypothetical protein